MSKNWKGIELDDGLMIAAERYAGNMGLVHHVRTLLGAYRNCYYPICLTQEQADVLALRLRRILRGMDAEEAYRLWKEEFAKTKKLEGQICQT